MREDATLEAAQKVGGNVLCKLVLTLQSGAGTVYTYSLTSTDRLLNLSHTEQEWSQTAQVTVNDSSGTLAALTLEGCSGVVSWGYGSTYSDCAPLEVIASKTDSMQGRIVTTLSLAGLFNMMGEDEASEAYTPDRINTDTVKDILTAIAKGSASGGLDCFNHCKEYTITFDSEDAIIDSFKPSDYFSVAFKESRLSAFGKALAYTKCKAVVKDNSGAPRIHVYVPTISGDTWVKDTAYVLNDYVQPTSPNYNFTYRCTKAGTSDSSEPSPWKTTAGQTNPDNTVTWTCVAFDYEYNDAYGDYHNFFDKSVRKRLVLPNKVIVSNHPTHRAVPYTGNFADSDSYTALGRYITEHHYTRLTSDAQGTAIAKAKILNYQLAAERGHGIAPTNCLQEVGDYVKITDSRASDLRIGNVGFINRWYSHYPKEPTRFGFEFRFGSLLLPGLAGTMPPRTIETTTTTAPDYRVSIEALSDAYSSLWDYMESLQSNQSTLINYLLAREQNAEFSSLSVTQRFQGPMGADKYT